MSTAIEFRAVRQPSSTADTALVDVQLLETFNRTASAATLTFTDADGTKLDDYPFGQRVQIQHSTDGGNNWTTRLEGFAADRNRTSELDFPALEVDVLAYNHLLRRRHVFKTYSSSTVSTILQDLIETFTGVTWNASNVTVTNDKTISREFKGERVDEAIAYLSSISADEEWFVNDSLEFVFQEQDTSTAAGIGDTDVIRHDFPTRATVGINRYELFYNTGGSEDRIIVEDLPAQEDLKDKLNAARAVEISETDTLPEITDRDRAEEIARQRLDAQSEVQTGTVTVPLGRFGTEVGDVLNLTVSDAGITNEDFRVAAIEYRWQEGETVLTLAENTDFVDDILVALSDSLDNVRARDADTTVTATQFLDVISGVTVTLSVTARQDTVSSGTFIVGEGQSEVGHNRDTPGQFRASVTRQTINTKKATKAFLNLVRDLWQDGNSAFIDLTHMAIGTGTTDATVGDTALGTEGLRDGIGKFGEGSAVEKIEFHSARFTAGGSLNGSDLTESGVFDAASSGNMYLRTTFDALTHGTDTIEFVDIEAEIDNDGDLQGALVNKGQERLADLVLGESNHEPANMLYGTGTTAAAVTDTSLGSQQHSDAIDSTADRSTGVTDIKEETTAGEANTTNWSEIGYENSSNELLARTTFPALSSDVTLVANYRFQASNA